VVTPYIVPATVTGMTVSRNLLHVTAGPAGYAIYQIPGVTPVQYGLSGNCSAPVTWTLSPSTAGTLMPSGLFTAPASIAGSQTVTVTATSTADTSMTAPATVNLSQAFALSLSPGPN